MNTKYPITIEWIMKDKKGKNIRKDFLLGNKRTTNWSDEMDD